MENMPINPFDKRDKERSAEAAPVNVWSKSSKAAAESRTPFQPVPEGEANSFELDDLQPGDRLDVVTRTGGEYAVYRGKSGGLFIVDMLVNKGLPSAEYTGKLVSPEDAAGYKISLGSEIHFGDFKTTDLASIVLHTKEN